MAKKRKSIASSLDEVDRNMYATFCSAANSLSQLYTQAMNHHKLSFQAGERHGLEKLYQWVFRQQEAGARVTTVDILNYLQNELDISGDEPSMSPRGPVSHHHHSQAPAQFANTGFLLSGPSAQFSASQAPPRSEHCENQPKNTVFSNALSSPVRRTLQHYHLAQGGHCSSGAHLPPPGNVARSNENSYANNQNRDSNSTVSFMDMH